MKRLLSVIFVFFLTSIVLAGMSQAEDNIKRVAILPFSIHAERDLSFLREGILDMLSTRLTWKDHVMVIEKEAVQKQLEMIKPPITKDKALMVGRALNADYVILGSLTVFGQSASLDAKILDVKKTDVLVTAFDQSKGFDNVIPTINKFAQDINAKIMGRYVAPPPVYAQPSTPPVSQQAGQQGQMIQPQASTPQIVQPVVKKGFQQLVPLGTPRRFNFEIVSMDSGDLDRDGKPELVIASDEKVAIFKWEKNTLHNVTTVKGGFSPNQIYVSVGDMDNNGSGEVYVTNLASTTVSSYVIERSKGKGFTKTINGIPWLLRVINIPGKGKVLVGQRRTVDGGYQGKVKILKRDGDKIVDTGVALNLPRMANVFNFVLYPTKYDKEKFFTILLDPFYKIRIYDVDGHRIWKSDEYWGGTLTYIEDKSDIEMSDTGKRLFIAPPMFLVDIDNNGQPEVVISKNKSTTYRITENYAGYSSGNVYFMDWTGNEFKEVWVSPKRNGTIVGYELVDLDNDGIKEFVIATVTKAGYVSGKSESEVMIYQTK